jgi:hypothetical protein
MKTIRKVVLILSVLVSVGCGLLSQVVAPTATVPAAPAAGSTAAPAAAASTATGETPVTAGPTQDACARDALRTYLRVFAIPMAGYEFSLVQVFSLTMHRASPDQFTAPMAQAQSSRDSIAAMQTPYCAQKMQAALLSSINHMIAGMKLNVAGDGGTKSQAEFAQAQSDFATVQTEFAALTAKAGLDAASPTP